MYDIQTVTSENPSSVFLDWADGLNLHTPTRHFSVRFSTLLAQSTDSVRNRLLLDSWDPTFAIFPCDHCFVVGQHDSDRLDQIAVKVHSWNKDKWYSHIPQAVASMLYNSLLISFPLYFVFFAWERLGFWLDKNKKFHRKCNTPQISAGNPQRAISLQMLYLPLVLVKASERNDVVRVVLKVERDHVTITIPPTSVLLASKEA